jgi:hypothetical protein
VARIEGAEMDEDVAHPAPARGERLEGDAPAAGHLGSDGDEASTAGRSGRGAGLAEIADDDRERRAEGLHRGDVAAAEVGVVGRLDNGAREDVERGAARMQVEEGVAQG